MEEEEDLIFALSFFCVRPSPTHARTHAHTVVSLFSFIITQRQLHAACKDGTSLPVHLSMTFTNCTARIYGGSGATSTFSWTTIDCRRRWKKRERFYTRVKQEKVLWADRRVDFTGHKRRP